MSPLMRCQPPSGAAQARLAAYGAGGDHYTFTPGTSHNHTGDQTELKCNRNFKNQYKYKD